MHDVIYLPSARLCPAADLQLPPEVRCRPRGGRAGPGALRRRVHPGVQRGRI